MRIDILTLFTDAFESPLRCSILGRARERGRVTVNVVDIRDFATDKHKVTDDAPYGGGPGMVLKPEPIFLAVESLKEVNSLENIILLSPQGRTFNQEIARELALKEDMVLICGRYEGVDDRVRLGLIMDEISIGDYVLSGGEIPALAVVDAVSRLVSGVVGDEASVVTDSFYKGLLGFPQYTRPRSFRGMNVPDVLLSGNHKTIEKWRVKEAFKRTLQRRPDLVRNVKVGRNELALLEEAKAELDVEAIRGETGTE
ncbi:MAG: tRNA (guanosine(37)-N1)-methyltransferase TrmD [Candidatus Hydrogenedentes bacterium]|nr:tRNA (guanosine(37)-N1)-methyltransferase TrmD [Candidatus Hydrogenedentota bacterium]